MALVALCVDEVASLVTLAVAAATAPLMPDDPEASERPGRAKRHPRRRSVAAREETDRISRTG